MECSRDSRRTNSNPFLKEWPFNQCFDHIPSPLIMLVASPASTFIFFNIILFALCHRLRIEHRGAVPWSSYERRHLVAVILPSCSAVCPHNTHGTQNAIMHKPILSKHPNRSCDHRPFLSVWCTSGWFLYSDIITIPAIVYVLFLSTSKCLQISKISRFCVLW